MELRKSTRYRLSSPAHYGWESSDAYSQTSQGKTRDISARGAFIVADECPPVGARIELKILLPKLEGSGVGMRLHGKGHVLRVEQGSTIGTNGFAAFVQFRPEVPDGAVPSQR